MQDVRKMLVTMVAGVLLLGGGCDEGDEAESAQQPSAATASAETEGEVEAEEEVEAEAEADVAPPAEGDVVAVDAFVKGFEQSKDDWMGKTVTVKGFYLNATKVGGEIQNMSIAASADEMRPNISCYFAEAPDEVDLMQDDPVTVTGKVDDRFGAALVDCSQVE